MKLSYSSVVIIIALMGVGAGLLIGWMFYSQKTNAQVGLPMIQGIGKTQMKMLLVARKLSEDQATWSRMMILNAIDGLENEDQIKKQLSLNVSNAEVLLQPLYQKEIVVRVADYLTKHNELMLQYIKAKKTGDSNQAAIENSWYENSDRLAALLSSMNPYIEKTEMKKLLEDNIKLTKDAIDARQYKHYDTDASVYDELQNQSHAISDYIAVALIKQFPGAFGNE